MDSAAIVVSGLLAGAFAAALAVMFTAPPENIVPAFACGLVTWIVRGGLVASGLGVGWATVLASVAAVLVAAAATPRHVVTPVVLISAVFPIAAGVAVFNAIIALFRVSTATGVALQEASATLSANIGKAFSTFVAIAVGLQIGSTIIRSARRRREG